MNLNLQAEPFIQNKIEPRGDNRCELKVLTNLNRSDDSSIITQNKVFFG
jgi:hypothetical protein